MTEADARALAVSTAGRYAALPDAPTVAETLPGVDYASWLGLATTPGTPKPIVDRLNREVAEMLKTAEVRQQLANLGGEASPSTPDQMRDKIAGEIVRWRRVMEIRKISPN